MSRPKPLLALISILILTLPATGMAEDANDRVPTVIYHEKGRLQGLLGNYQPPIVSPVNEGNTTRLESLLRGGNLYLSLQDTIALALENNINVEVQRYGALVSDANV